MENIFLCYFLIHVNLQLTDFRAISKEQLVLVFEKPKSVCTYNVRKL